MLGWRRGRRRWRVDRLLGGILWRRIWRLCVLRWRSRLLNGRRGVLRRWLRRPGGRGAVSGRGLLPGSGLLLFGRRCPRSYRRAGRQSRSLFGAVGAIGLRRRNVASALRTYPAEHWLRFFSCRRTDSKLYAAFFQCIRMGTPVRFRPGELLVCITKVSWQSNSFIAAGRLRNG